MPQTGDLKKQKSISHGSEAWKVKIKEQAWSDEDEGLLQVADCFLPPHLVEGDRQFCGVSFISINPIDEDSTLMTQVSPKGPTYLYQHIEN